jgi:APA family basic amino acid/polyamine antiporter
VYFTLGKIGLIVLFIIGGFWFLSNDNYNLVYNNLKTGDLLRELLSPGFWIGSIFVSYAYSGWNATSYIIEDIENPKKNVLKSTVYGTLIVTCLYCLLTFIFLASSPASEMAGKEEIGYIAAVNLFGSNAGMMISSAIAFFLISSISAMTIVGPRVLKRVNQDYQLLKLRNEEKEDPNKPPRWALKIQTLISVVILASSSFDFIITSMGFLLSIFTTLTAVGVIILRVKERDRPRPWKVPLYPITPLIYCIFNFWVIYYVIINRPASAITGFVFLVLGLVTYYYLNNKRSSRKAID